MCKEKAYRVSIKVRNNLMLKAVENIGEKFGPKFCVKYGIDYINLLPFIELKASPYNNNGDVNINILAKTLERMRHPRFKHLKELLA